MADKFTRTKAMSHFELKAVNAETRVLTGIATTPTPDHALDVVNPTGAKYSLPLPLLYAHDHKAVVGQVESARAGAKGIEFTARIPKIDEPGTLKDRCDLAWQEVREKLINSVSIGFIATKATPMRGGGMLIDEWTWLELSLCVVPMNPEALITSRRSLDLLMATHKAQARVVRLREPDRGRVVRLK